METRKKTKSGVLVWTPAPVRTSPTTSVLSEDVWADEDDEEAEKDDDFFSQMDENGIIGLFEALEGVELKGSSWDSDAECNPNLYPGPLTLEEADTSGHERDTPKEQDLQRLSPFEDSTGREEEQRNECMTEWDKYLDMTEEENDGDEAVTWSDRKRKKNKPTCTSRERGTMNGLAESNISKEEIDERSSPRSCSAHLLATEPSRVSNHHCRISQPASPIIAVTFPHLLHLTAEELAAAPGIDAETLPAISFTESLPESQGSVKSSPRCPVVKLRASHPPAAMFNEEVLSNYYSGVNNGPVKASDNSDKPRKQPTPSPRKMRQHSPEATSSRTRSPNMGKADALKFNHQTSSPGRETRTPKTTSYAAEVDESRKGPLSYRTPDFSNVEPRVHFPKGGYKPPKSRHFSKRTSLSPEPPFVFKSPADIVKEVLLNDTDGSAASSDSYKPPTRAPNSTVPQEFRSRQQATTLLDQLQEDYNRLLTKYADAENTIDRLRLEAKVNLYSDPPKPGHLVQSGLNQDTSKFMMLDFPQAQRAALNSASLHPNEDSTHQRSASACSSTRNPDPQMGQQLVKILYNQADKFLQQLQTFEDLIKSKKLRPLEQIKGLSQLTEGLSSLERGYLLARNEHKLLQQRGAEMCHFDAERELEGLIFQCGLLLDELKEQVDQGPDQPYSEAPLSSPPHPTPPPVAFEFGESEAHPQSPPVALLVDPGENAVVTATEESDEEEETFNSHYLKPLNGKQRRVEEFSTLMDPYQSFKELPKLLDQSQREGAPALRSDLQPGDEEKERPGHGTGNLAVQESLLQRNNISDQDSPPVGAGKQRTSRSSSPSRRASSQSATLPVLPPSSRRKLEVGKSHSSSLSSLGEITALERSNSKLQTGHSRVLSQDGIISPETDSGFVCSETGRLSPAAAPSPPHQRAPESVSVPQEGNQKKPQIGPGSAASPAPSPSHSHTAMNPRRGPRLSHDRPSRTRHGQRRRAFSSSPECVVRQTEQTRVDSGTSEFGLESDTSHAVSEDRRNNQYAESNSLHHSSPGSSPAAQRHHGDSLRMLSSSRVANRNDAIQTLQAEVTRLRERLESCLRNTTPVSSVRAAPSAQENYTHHNTSTPRIRSGERWGDVSRGGRDRRTVDEVEESTPRRITREGAPSAPRPQPANCSEPSSPQPRPLVSRCTQTSTSAPDSCRSQTNTVHSRTHPRQHPAVSGQGSETADEPDSRGRQAPLCPQCLSRHQGQPETGGDRELTHSSCCHRCPLCRYTEPSRSAESDCRRFFDSPSHTSCRPAVSPDRGLRSGYFAAAAPPELLQCMPVCPPPLLLYSAPLYVSPSNSTSRASGGKGRRESRGRTRCFLSTDKQHTTDTSLSRAIRAARHMKHTSGHMARSLATGLHYQELLTQSCSH